MKLDHLIRNDLKDFEPYQSAKSEKISGKIWLNANESPWNEGSPAAPSAFLNRYPEAQSAALLEKLSDFYQTDAKNILITRGSDEAIDLLIRLCCTAQQDGILTCPPTFGMYEICARIQGAFTKPVPLNREAGFQLDLDAIEASWNPRVKLIFLCSPNNPTGNLLNKEDILTLCQKFQNKSLVVVDEAYIEYADSESLIQKLPQYDNLVILRTFSKALGLAGIRCGTLIAHPDLIQWLNKITMPYPLSVLTELAALAAFSPKALEMQATRIKTIRLERDRLKEYFKNHPAIEAVFPSDTNFLLITTENANAFMRILLEKGVVPRQIPDQPLLKNAIRISVGLPVENTQVMEILDNALSLISP